jgi:hypothetical protein
MQGIKRNVITVCDILTLLCKVKKIPYFSVDNMHLKLFRHSFVITFYLPLIIF